MTMPEERAAAWATLASWGRERDLNPLDALMWRTERPPEKSWAGVVMMLLDDDVDWDVFRASHEWALKIVPRFTERVVDPILPTGPPQWAPDPKFDLDYHVRRTHLPAPGTMRQLEELAQTIAVTPSDKNRSPWQGTFVEGLEGGRSAYLMHIHHVVMDGGGATQMFSVLLDRTREEAAASVAKARRAIEARAAAPAAALVPVRDDASPHLRAQIALDGLQWQARTVRRLAGGLRSAASSLARAPRGTVKGVGAYVGSVARVVQPPAAAESDLLLAGGRTRWRFRTFECDVAELKVAANAVGGTVNDAFVCAVLGGIRAYHEAHGTQVGDVPISMPVSMRRDNDPGGGNRFAGAFFSAPSGIADPTKRMEAMRERVDEVRGEPALDMMGTVTPFMNLLPTAVVNGAIDMLTTSAVLTTSSWRGIPHDAYLAGALVERLWVFGPLPGTTMCAAMNSHGRTGCIGVNVDADTYPDTEVLWRGIQQGINEILELGRSVRLTSD